METGNKPHPIVPKGWRVAKDNKGNLFFIVEQRTIQGECREVGTDNQAQTLDTQKFLSLLTSLDCKPEIKIRTKCPKEES